MRPLGGFNDGEGIYPKVDEQWLKVMMMMMMMMMMMRMMMMMMMMRHKGKQP